MAEQCHPHSFCQHSLQYWYEKAEGETITQSLAKKKKKMGEPPAPLMPLQTNLEVAVMPTLNQTVDLQSNEE